MFAVRHHAWIFIFSLMSLTALAQSAPPTEMDLATLRAKAFAHCQSAYQTFKVTPVPMLDPPQYGSPKEVGLVYQEELAVGSSKILDQNQFYFLPKPRLALNNVPMDVYVDVDGGGVYQQKTWEDINPNYSSPVIQPPIDKNAIPSEGRVLTELIVGHSAPGGGYPELFNIRSNGYVRFCGFSPQSSGATLRLGAHGIFGLGEGSAPGPGEDFPSIREVYASAPSTSTATVLMLVESRLFCGALSVDLDPAHDSDVVVDGYWYTREDFDWQKDSNSGFVAYSSMLWKTEQQTPNVLSDEAHDSDTVNVHFADTSQTHYMLQPPMSGLRVQDMKSAAHGESAPTVWELANEDRDPSHYADFAGALGSTNYNFRSSYRVRILESDIKTAVTVYEHATNVEYADNIVVASTLRENIKKATSASRYTHFKYRTTAYYP